MDINTTLDYMWTRKEGKRIRIGLRREYVQESPITFIELRDIGQQLARDQAIGLAAHEHHREAEIDSPIAGKIVERNMAVHCKKPPTLLNEDPEGAGWLLVIEPEAP